MAIASPSKAAASACRKYPRIFVLTWDNSKIRTRDQAAKMQVYETFGCVFPDDGYTTTGIHQAFESMAELRTTFGLRGWYEVQFLDEVDEQQL